MTAEYAATPLTRLINQAKERLERNKVESPRLAAEFLLAHALGWEPAELRRILLFSPEQSAPPETLGRFSGFIERHTQGEPVAYIVGEWEFYGIPLFVSPAVLIPRPESEMLVAAALADLKGMDGPARIADLGAGSGCLGIAVLKHFSGPARLLAVDKSPEALTVARRNMLRHHLENRMALLEADFTRPFAQPETFDLILANPPYVSAEEYRALAPNVRAFEPCSALVPDSGPGRAPYNQTGLEHIAGLAVQCAAMLRPGGRLLMEIGGRQGAETMRIFREHGGWINIQIQPDLAGHDRLLSANTKA